MAPKTFKAGNNEVVGDDSNRTNKTVVNLSNKLKNNKSRNSIYVLYVEVIKKPTFLTSNAKNAFNYLKQIFIKTLIFWYFDVKYYIWIETNI